jgi:hypothetical protein
MPTTPQQIISPITSKPACKSTFLNQLPHCSSLMLAHFNEGFAYVQCIW